MEAQLDWQWCPKQQSSVFHQKAVYMLLLQSQGRCTQGVCVHKVAAAELTSTISKNPSMKPRSCDAL